MELPVPFSYFPVVRGLLKVKIVQRLAFKPVVTWQIPTLQLSSCVMVSSISVSLLILIFFEKTAAGCVTPFKVTLTAMTAWLVKFTIVKKRKEKVFLLDRMEKKNLSLANEERQRLLRCRGCRSSHTQTQGCAIFTCHS